MKTITKKDYEKAVKAAKLAVLNVSTNHNHVHAKTYNAVLIQVIMTSPERVDVDIEKAHTIIYTTSMNYGNKKYPDFITVVNEWTVNKSTRFTPKTVDGIAHSRIIAVIK